MFLQLYISLVFIFLPITLCLPRPLPPLDLYSSLIFFTNKILFFISCVFTTLLSLFFFTFVLHPVSPDIIDIINTYYCHKLSENDYIRVTIQDTIYSKYFSKQMTHFYPANFFLNSAHQSFTNVSADFSRKLSGTKLIKQLVSHLFRAHALRIHFSLTVLLICLEARYRYLRASAYVVCLIIANAYRLEWPSLTITHVPL